ncbi:hypothetical protein KAFR_0A06170 [Kazachstania africana CBS 2517]|uniref:Glutaredoxin domain-containing protein n=1 Tax=Kazachstania africana (strain ATCC 22294 / BCRC 22015 / CBS 2517 / CECT 1963 / NBRC 1671 / NRRL Y-8276) TaxID=1071382 RepID=H2ANV2_KAZAF|nr:hypothetical protein KAFR_0A06170 [Kazachstania africana CBS 2517]CCF56052.1 hypothetical protein KAFR_0A06170 [Kazachstania africana CBS 2517]
MSTVADYELKAKELISSNKFFQLIANWCPDCQYTNSILTKFDVLQRFKTLDIGDLPKDEQETWRVAFKNVTGSRNLPTIFIDGRIWATETEIHNCEDGNVLPAKFKEAGLL